jgi:mannonate dehydratase
MKQTWRWFGPDDTVSLANIVQAGATGVVTALDHIATGAPWPLADIQARKMMIEEAGLSWEVVESVPLHNNIKTRSGNYLQLIENYKESIRNLGQCGIRCICYNFMPVVDWTRTSLNYSLPNQSEALRFEMVDFAAYDLFVLKRPDAEHSYTGEVIELAQTRFATMSQADITSLERNIIAGLPGGEGSYNRPDILATIEEFTSIGNDNYRKNLIAFLCAIIPAAESAGVQMAIHPDDPPFSLFGLPRVVSTADDARVLLNEVSSSANGLTMCAGSYGARSDNDLVAMVKEFGSRIYFVHLRNIKREEHGSFHESEHLDGDNDIVGIVQALLSEEKDRGVHAKREYEIPMRPDHGHTLAAELGDPNIRPGYSFAGRMKGLAELRGVIHTIERLTIARPTKARLYNS